VILLFPDLAGALVTLLWAKKKRQTTARTIRLGGTYHPVRPTQKNYSRPLLDPCSGCEGAPRLDAFLGGENFDAGALPGECGTSGISTERCCCKRVLENL
jgi:hypothetical protein